MRLIKSFFIAVLVISTTACFATVEEEAAELESAIYNPIVKKFPDKESSWSRFLSLGILEKENSAGKQFSFEEAGDAAEEIVNKPPLNNKVVKCVIKQASEYSGKTNGEMLRNMITTAWTNQLASCGNFAYMVLVAYAFNEMNNKVLSKPQYFTQAMIIKTTKGTGDHSFVLIKGKSGAIFIVDPWSQKLGVLDIFNKWPDQTALLNNKDELNKLFKYTFNGEDYYYDILYVNPNTTTWEFDSISTNWVLEAVTTKNPHMKRLYDLLKIKNFPLWVNSYDELFQGSDSPTAAKTEIEHKKE